MTHQRAPSARGGGNNKNLKNTTVHDYSKAPPTILKNNNRVNHQPTNFRSSSNYSTSSNSPSFKNNQYGSSNHQQNNGEDYEDNLEEDYDPEDDEDEKSAEDSRSVTSEETPTKKASSANIQRIHQFQSQHVSTLPTIVANVGNPASSTSGNISSPRSSNSQTSPRVNNRQQDSSSSTNRGSKVYPNSNSRYHSTHYNSLNPSSANLINVSYHSDNINTVKSGFDQVTQVLLSRKPLLHMIVLFAADIRVRNYAQQVQETFLSQGINVYTQLGCYTKERPQSIDDYEFIKPDYLQEIITNSVADYVAVIGDRNMKHRTCQAKKNGKLVEISIDDRVEEILQDWDRSSHSYMTEFPILESLNQLSDASDLTTDQVYELIEAFVGIRHIKDRVDRLKKSISELKEWKTPKSQKSIQTVMDEKMLSKLTTSNNAAIRLHKDLISACELINAVPENSFSETSRLDSTERGVAINSKHLHGEVEEPTQDTGIEEHVLGISSSLKQLLIETCEELIPRVEKLGDQMSDIVGTSSLWDAYIKEYHEEEQERQLKKATTPIPTPKTSVPTSSIVGSPGSSQGPLSGRRRNNSTSSTSSNGSFSGSSTNSYGSRAPSGNWSCPECTYSNKRAFTHCEMCHTSRPSEQEWIDTSANKSLNSSSNKKSTTSSQASSNTTTTSNKSKTTVSGKQTATSGKKTPVTTPTTATPVIKSTVTSVNTTATTTSQGSKVIITSTSPTNPTIPISPSTNPILNTSKAWQTPLPHNSNATLTIQQPLLGGLGQQITTPSQQPFVTNPQPMNGVLIRTGSNGGTVVGNIQYPNNMMVGIMGMPTHGTPVGGSFASSLTLGAAINSNSPVPQSSSQYDQEYPTLDQAVAKGTKKLSSTPSSSLHQFGDMDTIVSSPKPMKDKNSIGFPSSPLSSNSMSNTGHDLSQQFSHMQLFDNSQTLGPSQNTNTSRFSWDFLAGVNTNTTSMGQLSLTPHSQSSLTVGSPQMHHHNHHQVATSITDSLLSETSPPTMNVKGNTSQTPTVSYLPYFGTGGNQDMWGSTNGNEGSSWTDFSANLNSGVTSASPMKGFVSSGGLGFGGNSPFMSSFGTPTKSSAFSPFGESTISKQPTQQSNIFSSPSTPTKHSSRRTPVNQPCIVCGQESMYECNFCASLRRKGLLVPPTYFCSPEHQALAWKEHQKVHQTQDSTYH